MKSNKDTACKNCAFAVYNGDTQVDCSSGLLDNAREAGINVLECYDETKEFYVLEKTRCMFQRNKHWLERNKSNPLNTLREETAIPFHVCVLIKPNDSEDMLKHTIDCLAAQTRQPERVVTVFEHGNKILPRPTLNMLNEAKFNHWKMERMVDDVLTERPALNLNLHFKIEPYIVLFRCGGNITPHFLRTVEYHINEKFLRFGILTNPYDKMGPEPIHGVVIPKIIWQYFGNHIEDLENVLACQKTEVHTIQSLMSDFR